MDQFVKKVNKNLNSLISSDDKILVGVSGGADSISLMYVLVAFSKIKKFSLAVAHINHMARGLESKSDADYVAQISKQLNVPFFLKEANIAKECFRLKRSFQETARIIRYQFFEKTLSEINGTKIALAHSADDQVETILLNIIRGSGLKGLVGIPQIRGKIIRPFLQVYRSDIEGYLKRRGISFCNDSSNRDTKYLRNKIRKELIPYLEAYNPAIKKNLHEMSQIVKEDDLLLAHMTREIFNKNFCLKGNESKRILWEIEIFLSYPLSLQRRLIRETFFKITGELVGITNFHIEQILNLFYSPKVGKLLNLPKNVLVKCSYFSISFEAGFKTVEQPISRSSSIPITIPGVTELEGGQIQVNTQIIKEKINFSLLNPQIEAYFDIQKTGSKLKARFFREGDRFQPLGMSGKKKLKAFFIDNKIPQNLRRRIPILTNDKDDIIWVYGQRIAHFCRVTDKTKTLLHVQGSKTIN